MPRSALAHLFQLWDRRLDLRGAAFNRGARQFYRGLGGKAKSNKERRLIHVDSNLLVAHIERLIEGQRCRRMLTIDVISFRDQPCSYTSQRFDSCNLLESQPTIPLHLFLGNALSALAASSFEA